MKLLFTTLMVLVSSFCYSQVVINEIQSSNSSTIADNFGEYDDWIEIHNPEDFQVDIGGLVLKDNVDTWQIPANTILLPNEYFLLWADDEEHQGDYHTNFRLSATNGEFLGLFESDSLTEIESVNIPPLMEDQSYGKCLNGEWTVIDNPTPLTINDCQLTSTYDVNNDWMIYPTLTTGIIHVDLNVSSSEVINLYLFSINGKLLLEKAYYVNSFTVDLSNLIPDVYVLKIHAEQGSYLKKIVRLN